MPVHRLRSAMPGAARDLEEWYARDGSAERLKPPFDPAFDEAGFRSVRRFEDGALDEEVEWDEPAGLGRLLHGGGAVEQRVARVLAFRHRRTRDDLTRHLADDGPRLKVAITGASGMVGTELSAFLRGGGHEVVAVKRGTAPPPGVDAVVNLAGEPIAGHRWNDEVKRRILDSRVETTRRVAEHAAAERTPVIVSASAIGYYGDRGDEALDEESGPGTGFLAEVAQAWEGATRPATEAGVRVVIVRIGLVQSAKGGALATMLPAFKAGAGGPMAGGRHFQSWIHLDDLVGIVHFAIRTASLEGPVNGTAPNPVTQREYAATLGRVLHRPAIVPAPAAALNATFGREMAHELLLASQRVLPARALSAGYAFLHPELEPALRFELGRPER